MMEFEPTMGNNNIPLSEYPNKKTNNGKYENCLLGFNYGLSAWEPTVITTRL